MPQIRLGIPGKKEMKFKKIHIRNFKCFNDRSWEFAAGLNIVFGPNESGKSTLYQALVLGLFGFDETRTKTHFGNLERKDFIPLGCDFPPYLQLTFSRGENLFTIERNFDIKEKPKRSLSEKTVSIQQGKEGNPGTIEKFKSEDARNFIREQLGGINEEAFQKYASINHAELSQLDPASLRKENEEMGESIIKLVESRMGKFDVRKRVDEELKVIRSEEKNEVYSGNIGRIEKKISESRELEENLSALKKNRDEKSHKLNDLTIEHENLKTILDKIESRRLKERDISNQEEKIKSREDEHIRLKGLLDEQEKIEDSIRKYPLALKDNVEGITKDLEQYNKSKDRSAAKREGINSRLLSKRQELQKSLENFNTKFRNFQADDVKSLKLKDDESKTLADEIHNLKIEQDLLKEEIDKGTNRKRFYSLSAIAAILIGVILLILGIYSKLNWLWLLFIIISFMSISAILLLTGKKSLSLLTIEKLNSGSDSLKKLEETKANIDLFLIQQINKLELSNRSEVDEKYKEFYVEDSLINQMKKDLHGDEIAENLISVEENALDDSRKEILDRTGYHTLQDLSQALKELNDLLIKLENIDERIERENASNRFQEIGIEIGKNSHLILEMKDALRREFQGEPLGEDEIAVKEKRFQNSKNEITSLTAEIHNLDGEIKAKEESIGESVEELEEGHERLKQAQNARLKEKEELEYLRELLTQMEKDYKFEFLPKLEERALELFKSFAPTSDKIFSFNNWPEITITSTELRDFEEKHLSHGTRDQLYFAFRIAWSDILTPEKLKLPLMWDDPFVNWDMERIKGAAQISLKLIEMGHQLILFTHRDELVDAFCEIFPKDEILQISLNS